MKYALLSASALAISAASAHAAGLDRSGQSVAPIFAEDNTANLSFGYIMPSVTGEDSGGANGSYDDSVGENYSVLGMSYTNRVGPRFSYSVIFDQPYGADINYGADPTLSNLGGTEADLNSEAVSFVGRYQFSDRFSVFAGVKAERVDATVSLNGQAYGQAFAAANGAPPAAIQPLGAAIAANGGYNFEMDQDTRPGYLVGAAFEIPDIALRIAGTYHFEIEHTADVTESIFSPVPPTGPGIVTVDSEVDYKTPASFNLEFQTGIAADTLLIGSYRWTEFSEVDLIPTGILNSDLVNLEDGHRYTLGVGRRFSDALSGSATVLYEPKGEELVSPLGPTNGLWGLSVGGAYAEGAYNISGGINYSWLGDAKPEVGGVEVAEFEDNHSFAVGLRAEIKF